MTIPTLLPPQKVLNAEKIEKYRTFMRLVDEDNLPKLKKLYSSMTAQEQAEILIYTDKKSVANPKLEAVPMCLLKAVSVPLCDYLCSLGADQQLTPKEKQVLCITEIDKENFAKAQYLYKKGYLHKPTPGLEVMCLEKLIYHTTFRYKFYGKATPENLKAINELAEEFTTCIKPRTVQNKLPKALLSLTRTVHIRPGEVEHINKLLKTLLDKGAPLHHSVEAFHMTDGNITALTEAVRLENKGVFDFLLNYNPTLENIEAFRRQLKEAPSEIFKTDKSYYINSIETLWEKLTLEQTVAPAAIVVSHKVLKI